MPYDEQLAERIRTALSGRTVREVRMFGGLSFMVDEKLAAAADSQGRLMLKIDPSCSAALLERPGASTPEMGGRSMSPAGSSSTAPAPRPTRTWSGGCARRCRIATLRAEPHRQRYSTSGRPLPPYLGCRSARPESARCSR